MACGGEPLRSGLGTFRRTNRRHIRLITLDLSSCSSRRQHAINLQFLTLLPRAGSLLIPITRAQSLVQVLLSPLPSQSSLFREACVGSTSVLSLSRSMRRVVRSDEVKGTEPVIGQGSAIIPHRERERERERALRERERELERESSSSRSTLRHTPPLPLTPPLSLSHKP